jgi:sugar phosphate isomerase/epimerase
MNPEIGLQLFSIKNELRQDYLGALEKVAQIGYKNVELVSTVTGDGLIFGQDLTPSQHRRALERLGLNAPACHVMPREGMDWEKIIASCLETGATALVIPFALFNDQQEVLDFCERINQAAALCKKNAVQLYYHNHFQEFQKFDGQAAMDTLLANMDSDLVKFEFDSYWAIRGGQDPLAWLQKMGRRCDMLHQKDLPNGVQPINLFDLMIQHPEMTVLDLFETIGTEQFTEIGAGVLNIAGIIKAGIAYGNVRYIFVEQDKTSKDEIESIQISYENLTGMLAGV